MDLTVRIFLVIKVFRDIWYNDMSYLSHMININQGTLTEGLNAKAQYQYS
jgi:hypothetical protein